MIATLAQHTYNIDEIDLTTGSIIANFMPAVRYRWRYRGAIYLSHEPFLYLRNKETQQTLWHIVDWLCNASVSCIRSNYMKAVSKRQNTAGLFTISVKYA